jgi:hypothetical protein
LQIYYTENSSKRQGFFSRNTAAVGKDSGQDRDFGKARSVEMGKTRMTCALKKSRLLKKKRFGDAHLPVTTYNMSDWLAGPQH